MIRRSQPTSRPTTAAAALTLAFALSVGAAPTMPVDAAPTYTLDLGARSDFVAQTTFVQCVGASMQIMINMAEPGADRTAATQRRLQSLARARSGPRPDGTSRQGASVQGWATGLEEVGAGPYRVVGATSLADALGVAARAMRETRRPVGLLVWRGRHAWVMSGFRATADPLEAASFKVTRAIVEDPLYPYGSSTWGPSPVPGQALTPTALGRQFVPRRSSARWLAADPRSRALVGKYVLVLPVDPRTITGWRRLV